MFKFNIKYDNDDHKTFDEIYSPIYDGIMYIRETCFLDSLFPPTGGGGEIGTASGDKVERAVAVAKILMSEGGFKDFQAAGIVGVYIDENGCDPGNYMKAEKAGKGASFATGNNAYGAGIASWTGATKFEALALAGYPKTYPIESFSLEQQAKIVVIQTKNGSLRRYYDGVRQTPDIEHASAAAVIITGGIGRWKWPYPGPAEAKALSDWYGRSNDNRFGASPYHWDLDKRRLAYARQVLEKLT